MGFLGPLILCFLSWDWSGIVIDILNLKNKGKNCPNFGTLKVIDNIENGMEWAYAWGGMSMYFFMQIFTYFTTK